ncbi:MAG: hypothetical protein Q9214_002239 [Letrouitia sp. 1 TL-2023]
MAEAIATVGLGASTVQFVSVTAKLTQRIHEFSSTAEEMPKALRSIQTQLPFLLETCQKLDESEKISLIIKECHREIEDLNKMISKILPGPGDPKLNRAFKAFKSIRYQDRFEHALRKIEHFKTDLILHCCRGTTELPKESRPVQKITHNLPSTPMAYSITRRRLLREVFQTFSDYEYEESGHKFVILHGMGGQVKTRLAFDYARQVSAESESVLVLWFDATSKQSLKEASKILPIDEMVADEPEREWLLIFDNYDDPDHFADIDTFYPPSHGSILITSRHADAGLLGKVIRISGMDEAEGLELLRHRTEESLEDPVHRAAAINVLHTLGRLPLAIDQAGAYIRQQRLPIHMFLQQYESQKKTILGVLTTWELSIQQVESIHITRSKVVHLLTIAAFLNHIEISERLFKEYAQRSQPVPEWLMCFTSGGEWDPHRFRNVVSKLLMLSLAQGRNDHTGDCYLSLHPMIKDWLQSRITDSDRSVYIMEAIVLLASYIESNVQECSLREARGILGHVDACMSSYSKLRTAPFRLGCGHLREHGLTFSSCYVSHGRYREAVEGLQVVLEHDVQVYGQKHTHTFRTIRHLADALVHGGQYHKAHDMLSKTFNDNKDVAGLETLHIVCALARVLTKLDRQAEAERCYETALKGYKLRKDPAKAHEIYLLYERLAEVKLYLDKYGEAESLCTEAHRGYEQDCAYDEDATLDMLRTAGGLANLHRTLGRYKEAEVSYREA